MNNFANIGKSVLLQSIGLQKNFTEIAESTKEVIDYSNSECKNCKCYAILQNFEPSSQIYKSTIKTCANCPKKTVTQQIVYKKIYHNEKNKYGYKPTLKTNAIKLLLLLHFQQPDRFGIIKSLDISSISNVLHCDIKTIRNNLEILANYNYISYSKTDTYYYTICLNDYESYYLPAANGGRGFFVMSKELLLKLIEIDNLVSLRIHIRELLALDHLNIKSNTSFSAINSTYKEIKLSLPDYCKPCIIKAAFKKSSHCDIFNITLNESSIRFEIDENYDSKLQKKICYNEYYAKFIDFMNQFNKIIPLINTNQIADNQYSQFLSSTYSSDNVFHLLSFSSAELEDLANLALQYSYDHVIDALSVIYKTYIMQERKIHNLGGLLQTIISSKSKISLQAA